MMEFPTNIKIAEKQMAYKVFACEKDGVECVIAPVDPNEKGQPKNAIIICPVCLSSFKTTIEDYQNMMKQSVVK